MDWLAIIGDAVWIMTLSLIAGASRTVWAKIPAGAAVPMQFTLKRKPLWRAPKPVALVFTPVLVTVIGLAFGYAARVAPPYGGMPLIIFAVRMALGPPFVMAHLLHLRLALETLDGEGKLKA